MFLNPNYNQIESRPNRWSIYDLYKDTVLEYPSVLESHYQHYTTTSEAITRDIEPIKPFGADVAMERRVDVGFLTAHYKYMYERGKYLEVYNDPVNYYSTLPSDYDTAIIEAENRIGNYRIGARRYITHLGGTIDHKQMDNLTIIDKPDFYPTDEVSFPLFPPKPPNIDKAPRVLLTTSDSGYVDYIVSKHPSDSTKDAWRAEQGTGFRRFIFSQGNLTSSASATGLKDREVEIEDIETVLNTAINNATSSDFTTFLPADGEDITINIPGEHVIRSSSTSWAIEHYGDGFGSLPSSIISLDIASGDIDMVAGTTDIEIKKDGNIIMTAGTTSVTINTDGAVAIDAGSNNMSLTADTLAITGKLTVSGTTTLSGDLTVDANSDLNGNLNVSGITQHGA